MTCFWLKVKIESKLRKRLWAVKLILLLEGNAPFFVSSKDESKQSLILWSKSKEWMFCPEEKDNVFCIKKIEFID